MQIDFNIEKAEFINVDGVVEFSTLKLVKQNRTHFVVKGKLKLLREFSDDIKIGVEFFQLQGGEYRKMPYKVPVQRFCEFVMNEKLVMPEIFATSDLPPAEKCPYQPVK